MLDAQSEIVHFATIIALCDAVDAYVEIVIVALAAIYGLGQSLRAAPQRGALLCTDGSMLLRSSCDMLRRRK